MRKLCLVLAAAVLLLSACTIKPGSSSGDEPRLTVLATTYPVYLLASAVTEGVEGIQVERLSTGQVSCLHDYTLSVDDMKKIQRADVIAMNGAGLEEFMEDALAVSDAVVIDCSQGVELLENREAYRRVFGFPVRAYYEKLGFDSITAFACYLGKDYRALYGCPELSGYKAAFEK